MGGMAPSPLLSVSPEAMGQERAGITAQQQSVRNLSQNGSPLANAQLQQATNQNMANSAGIIASSKGINPAMAARTAAYNNANVGQQASNQSAQTQAQVQLGAQDQLTNSLQNQYNTDSGNVNAYNALSQQNNQFNASQQEANAKMGIGAMGTMFSAMAAEGGIVPQKLADGGKVQMFESGGMPSMGGGSSIPDPVQSINQSMQTGTNAASGILQANSSPGQVQQAQDPYAAISGFFNSLSQKNNSQPNSVAGQMMNGSLSQGSPPPSTAAQQGSTSGGLFGAIKDDMMFNHVTGPDRSSMTDSPQSSLNPDQVASGMASQYARGGKTKKVPALVSPGETYLKPSQAKAVAKGKANPLKVGERIPGTPKIPGNSYANDTVPKKLDAGGVVIPNSIMQSSDPAHNAYKFVQAVMAHQKAKGKR